MPRKTNSESAGETRGGNLKTLSFKVTKETKKTVDTLGASLGYLAGKLKLTEAEAEAALIDAAMRKAKQSSQ